jgi:tetratricopeptide (TPR) repeat protein
LIIISKNICICILFITYFLSHYSILQAQNYSGRYFERTKYAYEHDWRKDSEENLIALDLFIDIEKCCLNNDYTSAISLINKIITEHPHGRLGKPRITRSIGTRVSRDYCYGYRNKIYDFALTYKAILLCKINKFIEAQIILEAYLSNLKSLNNYSEDYKIDFLNDTKFIDKFSGKWTVENRSFANEISQRKDSWFFWEISQYRPDKISFMLLIALYRLHNNEEKALKTIKEFTNIFPNFEKKFNYKKLMTLNEIYLKDILTQGNYVFWNLYY